MKNEVSGGKVEIIQDFNYQPNSKIEQKIKIMFINSETKNINFHCK